MGNTKYWVSSVFRRYLSSDSQSTSNGLGGDARIVVAEAEARYEMQKGELQRAEAALAAARTNLEKPVVMQATLADADAVLAQTRRELDNLPFAIEAAKTQQALAAENVRRKELAGGAITGRVLREIAGT